MSFKKPEVSPIVEAYALDNKVLSIGQIPPEVDVNFANANLILAPIKKQIKQTPTAQTETGFQDSKIEPKRVIPYAVAHVFNHDVPGLLEMLEARKLEGLLSNTIVEQIYGLVAEGDAADKIQEALDAVDEEIKATEEKLSSLDGLAGSLDQVDNVFEKSEQNKNVTQAVTAALEELGQDPLTKDEDTSNNDYIAMLSKLTAMSPDELGRMYTTGIYLQALADCEFSLRAGISAGFVIETNERHRTQNRGFSRPLPAVKRHVANEFKELKKIGIGDNRFYDGVFNKNAALRIPKIAEFSGIDTVGYYCTLISREFLISSGLGRLAGTPLGQSFGASGDPMSKTFGTSNLKWVSSESSVPGSLSDYGLVRDDGNLKAKGGGKKRVLLLDGEVPSKWKTTTSSKKAWLDTTKSDPLNNKMNIFDKVINEAVDKFENADQFMVELLQRDGDRDLLTPRGLFTRVLKDFAKLLEGLTVESNAAVRGKNISEIALLTLSNQGTHDENLQDIKSLRRRLHIFACRLANMKRNISDDDPEDEVIRITAREASAKFQGGLEGLGTDKKHVALAVVALSDKAKPEGYKQFKKTGNGIFSSVVDDPDADGLMPVIVQIYEDLQEEAQRLAQSQDDTKTYLREGGTTRFSGFDGAITLAFLLECFAALTDMFTDMGIAITEGTLKDSLQLARSGKPLNYPATPEQVIKQVKNAFFEKTHTMWYRGGPGSRLNRARKFLLELVAASESDDTSNLFDENGAALAVEGVNEMSNLSYTGNVTPSELIDTLHSLSEEDDAPVKLFAIAKSLVDNMRSSTADISQRAAALRGDTSGDLPDDVVMLKELKSSKAGSEFITHLSPSQLKFAYARLETLKNASEEGHLTDKVQMSLYSAVKMLWEEKSGEFSHGAVIFAGLPSGSVPKELRAKGLAHHEAGIQLSIDKKSEILSAIDWEPIVKTIPLKYSVTVEEITIALEAEEPPTTFNELILALNYGVLGEEEPMPASDLLEMSSDPSQTREHLQLVLESFLLKQVYQKITNIGLTDECIQYGSVTHRDPSVKSLMQHLVSHIDIDDKTVDLFFKKEADGLSSPTQLRRNNIVLPQQISVSGTIGWAEPKATSEEVMTMYSLLSTKPFFVKRVDDLVLTRSVFDEVIAVFINMDGFEMDNTTTAAQLLTTSVQGKSLTPEEQLSYIKSSMTPNRLDIDTLYLSADVEPVI